MSSTKPGQKMQEGSEIRVRTANITAVIATRNRPSALARCLDAVLSGECLPGEIIIVDQSEGDETEEIVDQSRTSGTPILYIRQQRRGLSASRNAAIAHARCPVIAVTDDDCVPDSKWISVLERVFSSPNEPDAVTGRVLPLGPEIPGRYAVSSRRTTVRAEFCGKIEPWIIGTGGNFAMKRQWFAWIGPYDERLGAGSPGGGAEDMDLFYRLARARARLRYEPESLVYHERQSKARRIASRSSYGRGIGVFCAIWIRRDDLYALRILYRWLFIHSRLLASGLLRGEWTTIYEEILMLQGTIRGLAQGLFMREAT